MPRIVPIGMSLRPRLGMLVFPLLAGLDQISCEPFACRLHSQPSRRNFRVSSR